jgi:hypothetical protein
MTSMAEHITERPVRKSMTVMASAERAFEVFTDEFDSWWPRSHHIGKSPMKKTIVEGKVGGRCYTEQMDGTPPPDGSTRVDLEHRYFGRHGVGFEGMRSAVDSANGWGGLLELFAARARAPR